MHEEHWDLLLRLGLALTLTGQKQKQNKKKQIKKYNGIYNIRIVTSNSKKKKQQYTCINIIG